MPDDYDDLDDNEYIGDEDDYDDDYVRSDHDDGEDEDWEEPYENDLDFQDPGGRSALRAATKNNPRNLPCPTCDKPNRLTPKDVALGYQCDVCADKDEGYGF